MQYDLHFNRAFDFKNMILIHNGAAHHPAKRVMAARPYKSIPHVSLHPSVSSTRCILRISPLGEPRRSQAWRLHRQRDSEFLDCYCSPGPLGWAFSVVDFLPRCGIGKLKEHCSAVWACSGEWGAGLSVDKYTKRVGYSAVVCLCYALANVFRIHARIFHGGYTRHGPLKGVGRLPLLLLRKSTGCALGTAS
jgi:hypothetical protein